jgi:hypothetical protein
MIGRMTLAGLVLAVSSLATGCCHHPLCQSSCASPAVSRAPCCPTGAPGYPATAIPAAPAPVQAYSSPGVSY